MVSHHPLSQFFRMFLKALFLVLLVFILYTTSLSSLISDSSIKHHLYADDTQLFISFSASDFSQNIAHLETTIDTVCTWMSANLLSLNQSKTEFLFIGLPKQLAEVSDPNLLMPSNVTITPSDSARNLGVIFDSSLICPIIFPLYLNFAFSRFVTCVESETLST